MKRQIPYAVAAVLAASGISLVHARNGQDVNRTNSAPPVNFAQQPIATASTTQGAEGQVVESIVKAMNADPALQHAKITVQPVEGKIYLSGAALTQAQKKEANRIALAHAGETKVVNIILTDEA